MILICVPLSALPYVLENWPWGDFVCRGSEFAKDISIGVSIFTLVALATDRYNGIVNPLKKLQARSRMVLFTIGVTWTMAILFALPAVIFSGVVQSPEGIIYCRPFGNYEKTYIQ